MNTFKYISLLIIMVTFFSCTDDEEPTIMTPVLPETIGGLYQTDLHLINRNTDPDLADYYVDETITMENAGFIVDPGVVIEFAPNTRFQLGRYSEGFSDAGYINADGTALEPIVFRGTENISGSWNGIMVGCSSYDIRNNMNHCIIENAGGVNSYAIRIEDCTNGSAGLLSLTNSTIRNTLGNGLESEGDGVINQFSNNIFISNSGAAIKLNVEEFSHIDSGTRFDSNGINGVISTENVYSGRINNEEEHVWDNLNGGAYYINTFARIYNGSLTINPGVEIIMGSTAGLASDENAYISAVGTLNERIVIRGEFPTIPSWKGIFIYSKNSPNTFEYCQVSEAGVEGHGAFHLDSPYTNCCGYTASIEQCIIQNNGACGIYTDEDNLSYLTYEGNSFDSNSGAPICY